MSSPFTLKWGIMATGGIAATFTKDLLTDPAVRDVTDVRHELVAAASSTSKASAERFLAETVDAPGSPRAYGSYAELVADPDVDIVYVATPHSHHFQNVMLALEAGKHVLCEKPVTVTAAQARKLVAAARARKLFLMEAVWTRFFPLSVKVRELVASGAVGPVYRVFADLSFGGDVDGQSIKFPDEHRMVNRDLAGGATLDLGVYSLTWLFQILYHLQPEADKERPAISAAVTKFRTGVDEAASVVLHFPGHKSTGIATTSLRVASDPDGRGSAGPSIRIQGARGEIQVMGIAPRPLQYRVIRRDGAGETEVVDCPIPRDEGRGGTGHGMFWEADECARCLRDGRLESETMPLDETVAIMETMDEVLRQGGVSYPELIASDVYDAGSPLNGGRAA